MLDDPAAIASLDSHDALGVAQGAWKQLTYAFVIENWTRPSALPQNIVFSGMGGSALSASLSLTWPGYNVPFEICRSYTIPKHVGDKTLFIASSYSGNTEEEISTLEAALEKRAQIVVIASGGKLMEIAKERQLPLIVLPSGYQPRHAVLYAFKALVLVLEKVGLTAEIEVDRCLREAADFLKASVEWWKADIPTEHNYPKQIALKIHDTAPVIYSGPLMSPAAYKWKISFNENSKNIAWWNQFSELNHNEMIGWGHPKEKKYSVIELCSSLEHDHVQKRFDVTSSVLADTWPEPIRINAEGRTALEQLLWFVVFGDHVSIYLGLLNGVDPTPVDLIERFKRQLEEG